MTTSSERDRELRAIGLNLATLRLDLSLIRLGRALERRFNPDQPRWPAGSSDGGRWSGGAGGTAGRLVLSDSVLADGTSIASAVNHGDRDYDWDERHVVVTPDGASTVFETKDLTQTIRDGGTGEILSRSTWGPNGPEPDAVLQSVLYKPGVSPRVAAPVAGQITAGGIALYNSLAEKAHSVADILAMGFRASGYERNEVTGKLDWSGYVGQDAVNAACPRYEEAQALTDEAYAHVKDLGIGANPADFGTRVHSRIRDMIKIERDPDFKAEVSFLKSNGTDVEYGTSGSIRVDILEYSKTGQVRVYDIKTGRRGLSNGRMSEIAQTVYLNYPLHKSIIVIEMRPHQ